MYWVTLAMSATIAWLTVSGSSITKSSLTRIHRVVRQSDYVDLYDEEDYGDYEEPFIEPVREEGDYEYDESAGPFGNSIFDLDEIETDPIADIQYEYDYDYDYDYEEYNEIDDSIEDNEIKDNEIEDNEIEDFEIEDNDIEDNEKVSQKDINTTPEPFIIYKPYTYTITRTKVIPIIENNFHPIHQPKTPNFNSPPIPNPIQIYTKQPTPVHVYKHQPKYRYKFTPAELQYMYGKPKPQQQTKNPKPVKVTRPNPIQGFMRQLTNRVGKMVRFVQERIRNPRKIFQNN